MVDTDTFLTTLYVMVEDFCKARLPQRRRPGPKALLSQGEVVTLAIFSQWTRFESERSFYRYATQHLRAAFPTLPVRAHFNRLLRCHRDAVAAFALYLVDLMGARNCPYEALDGSGVATRNIKRRGRGWLAGQANIGWSNRLGWYEGLHLLTAVNPDGIITGFAFAPASTKDQPMAESFFALRQRPNPTIPSVGIPALGHYVADKGFLGRDNRLRWRINYGADLISAPTRQSRPGWPKQLRQWLARIRQIVETVFGKLHTTFGLSRERPHAIGGFEARLAARVALHNFCIWLNRRLGRSSLAFAELLSW